MDFIVITLKVIIFLCVLAVPALFLFSWYLSFKQKSVDEVDDEVYDVIYPYNGLEFRFSYHRSSMEILIETFDCFDWYDLEDKLEHNYVKMEEHLGVQDKLNTNYMTVMSLIMNELAIREIMRRRLDE